MGKKRSAASAPTLKSDLETADGSSDYDDLVSALEAEMDHPNSSVRENARRLLIIAKGR